MRNGVTIGGDFADGTIGRWLEESAGVFERFCHQRPGELLHLQGKTANPWTGVRRPARRQLPETDAGRALVESWQCRDRAAKAAGMNGSSKPRSSSVGDPGLSFGSSLLQTDIDSAANLAAGRIG